MRFALRLLLLAAVACVVLAGCRGTSSPHPSASAARSSVAAWATSPAVQHDEVVALRKFAGCATTATSGELAFRVDTSTTGQASIPGTTTPAYPHIVVTHWSVRLLHHLIRKTDAALNCAAPASTRASAKACVEHLPLPLSRQAITTWLTGVAGCMTGAPQ